MASVTWFVTGSSRGLGLEMVRQLVESPQNVVFATCRNPESATLLNKLKSTAKGKLHVLKLDLSDHSTIKNCASHLQDVVGAGGIDYLINNAGIATPDAPFSAQAEYLTEALHTNVTGTMLVSQTFVPFIERGQRKVIMNLGSSLGSIGHDMGPPYSSYSVTKAAINMLTYKQSKERPDLIVFVMDPGWVQTDMGGPTADLKPHESISGVLKVITAATPAYSGKFWRWNGDNLPW